MSIQAISPMLTKFINVQPQLNEKQQIQTQPQEQQAQQVASFSPMLAKTLLAQNKQILAPSAVVKAELTEAQKRVPGYKNELKDMLVSNKATILAVIPRIMNAKDEDRNLVMLKLIM